MWPLDEHISCLDEHISPLVEVVKDTNKVCFSPIERILSRYVTYVCTDDMKGKVYDNTPP